MMKNSMGWLCAACCAAAGVLSANEVRTYDVPEGETVTVAEPLPAGIDVLKTGAGRLVVTNDANTTFNGTVTIRQGILEAQSSLVGVINVLGSQLANTITVEKGAQLVVRVPGPNAQADTRFRNQLVLAGDGPDKTGALRFLKSPGGKTSNVDNLFSNILLTDDATFNSSSRIGFAKGTIDLGGHVLTYRTSTSSDAQFMNTDEKIANGTIVLTNSTSYILQGSPNLDATATLVARSGSRLDTWGSTPKGVGKVVTSGTVAFRIGAGTAANSNILPWPVEIESGTFRFTTYSTTPNMRATLTGILSGAGKLASVKGDAYGSNFANTQNLWLTNPGNSWTGGLAADFGDVWSTVPGSVPLDCSPITASASGRLNLIAGPDGWDAASLHTVLAHWDGSGWVNVWTDAGTTFADDLDFTQNLSYQHGGPGTLDFSASTPLDGRSRIRNAGGTLNVTTKDPSQVRRLSDLSCYAGTLVLANAGRVWAGEWDVANNVSGATNKIWYVGNTMYGGSALGPANNAAPARMVVSDGSYVEGKEVASQRQSSRIVVQDTGAKGAVLEVRGGAVTNTVTVAYDANTRGAYMQWDGDVRNSGTAGNDVYVGCSGGSYGYFLLAGGKYSVRDWFGFGRSPTAVGMCEIRGGEFKVIGASCVLSRGGMGELYMTGGSFVGTGGGTAQPSLRLGEMEWGDKNRSSDRRAGHGTITLAGGNPLVRVNHLVDMCQRTNTVFTGVVNLNAGVLETPMFAKSEFNPGNRPDTRAYLNFGGGTHRFYANNANVFGAGNRACDRVTSFPGGATFDVNGRTSANAGIPVRKPTGKGVAAISLPGAPLAGYLGVPEVYITGGGGAGATAHALFDPTNGVVTGIAVTCPGWDYVEPPTVVVLSADRKTDIVCAATLTAGDEQPSGGLVVTNSSATAGTFTLTGANSYTGATVVAGGTLKLGAADAIPSANEVRVAGGTFDLDAHAVSYARFGGHGTLAGTGSVTVGQALVFDTADLAAGRSLTVAAPVVFGADAVIDLANTNLLDRAHGAYTVATAQQPFARLPESNLVAPWSFYLSDGGKTLKLHYRQGTVLVFR